MLEAYLGVWGWILPVPEVKPPCQKYLSIPNLFFRKIVYARIRLYAEDRTVTVVSVRTVKEDR